MTVGKVVITCICSMIILLLTLQYNSVWFIPAFAQLGGPNGENFNLDGIWERIDDDPTEDMVYINQEGTQIIATFEPTGYCYEDPYNPTEGTEYAQEKDVFRGNLIGNTIQGEVVRCLLEERTVAWRDLNLRVSSDGRTLDGYYTDLDGQQYIQRYVFDRDLPLVSIEINAVRPVYDLNEPVEISGQVTNMVTEEESDVFIEVNGPDGQEVFSEGIAINSDGSFFTSFNLDDQSNEGTYTAVASHAAATDDITFEVGAPPPPVAPIIVTGAAIAAVGGGEVLLYKNGYLKGIKHGVKNTPEKVVEDQETNPNNLSIIDLRIECGLENSELVKKESSKGYSMITRELTDLEQKFSQAIDKILENRKKIKNIQKDIDFIKWCKEAKEDPNKILSKISEEVIGKFLTSIDSQFQSLMLGQIISVESDISVTKDSPKRIRKNITFSLNPIQAYIALVVYNNGVPVSSTKFIFAINTDVKIKNLTVYLEKMRSQNQAQLKQQLEQKIRFREKVSGNNDDDDVNNRGNRRIEIAGLLFAISIRFSKIKIGHIEKDIEPPLDLGKKEVEIKKKIILFSHDK